MTFVFIEAPPQIASREAQNNEFIIDFSVKSCSDKLTIFLFGEESSIQRYISSLYVSLWDYCLLYKKINLDSTVIPIVSNHYETLQHYEITDCFILDSFDNIVIQTILKDREKKGLSPIHFQPISCNIWDAEVIPLDWEQSTHAHIQTACVGGTFDCLHPGHKILLTLSAMVCDKLVIGLTTDQMLLSKNRYELIKPYHERERIVLDFLHQIRPSLQVEIHPLVDIYGPSVLMDEIQGIIVSLETIAGAKKINHVRMEKGMQPLTIFTVNRASKYNLSSTFIRQQAPYFCLLTNTQ